MAKLWTIPTVLRELDRVLKDAGKSGIMELGESNYTVSQMVADLTDLHMKKEMEIPGQTSIPVPETGAKASEK